MTKLSKVANDGHLWPFFKGCILKAKIIKNWWSLFNVKAKNIPNASCYFVICNKGLLICNKSAVMFCNNNLPLH